MAHPRAWEISNATPVEEHHPKCSARAGMLCDCEVLTQHPEYVRDYGDSRLES